MAASYELSHCLHIVLVIGKYRDVCRGISLVKEGGCYKERFLSGGISYGGKEFFMEGEPDIPALFKKQSEIK